MTRRIMGLAFSGVSAFQGGQCPPEWSVRRWSSACDALARVASCHPATNRSLQDLYL